MSLVRNILFSSALLVSIVGCGGGGGGGGSNPSVPGGGGETLYPVAVSTSGLTGAGLSVKLLSGSKSDSIGISSNGVKTFATKLSDGALYSVYITSQPSGQTCALGNNSSGTIASAGVTVSLSCADDAGSLPPTGVSVRVDVDTLASTDNVTLSLNGTETKTFSATPFNVSFSTKLSDGDTYKVTVDTPPAGKICNLYDASGIITDGISPLARLECAADTTPTYTIGGPVTGLSANGLRLNLNGSESVSIDAGSPSYAFSTALLSGSRYTVAVEAHPEGQICTLQNEEAYVYDNRSDVAVICSTGPHTIGGTVTGLEGNGLTLSLNGVEDLPISTGGGFVFPTALSDGMDFEITVKTQPAGQECTVYRGSDWNITASQSDTLVECVDKRYEVNVSVSPFSSDTPLVLRLNGSERLEVTSSSWTRTRTFSNRLLDGAVYDVSILSQPSGQHCTLGNNSGTISATDVTDITASCGALTSNTGPYSVNVTASGLLGSGLQLSLNGGAGFAVTGDGYWTFPSELADGAAYSVAVAAHPTNPLQRCRVENASGTITGGDISNVAVVCENAVAARYPNNGSQWLAYVKNPNVIDGATADTACDPGLDASHGPDACINGGEHRVIEADFLASCDGVTAADNLNAFDWTCDSTSGSVRIVSTGLRAGVLLSDLVDFEAVAFKENFVTINAPGSTYSTQPTVWWDNHIYVDNSGEHCCSYYSNDIALVTDNVPAFYTISNHSALLIQPGFAVSGYTDSRYIVSVYDDYYDTDFTWVEGKIDDVTGGTSGGIYLKGYFTVLKNIEVTNTGGTGIRTSVSNATLENVTATGNANAGIDLWGSNLVADGLTATGNQGTGPAIEITTGRSSSVRNVTASDNPQASSGLRIPAASSVTVENVVADRNGGYGVHLGEWTGHSPYSKFIIRNLSANDNGGTGIFAEVIDDGEVSNLSAHGNGEDGVHLYTARRTPVSNIEGIGNGVDGVKIFRWEQTTVDNVSAADNGGNGVSMGGSKLLVSDIVSANNGSAGFVVDGPYDSIWTNITTANNAGNGFMASAGTSGSDPNVFLGVTTVNNGGDGFNGTRFESYQFSSLLSALNQGHGMNMYIFTKGHVFADVASASNSGAGIYLDSEGDRFTGLLILGSNGSGNCIVDMFYLTEPGLTATKSGDCVNNYNSDAVIEQAADLTSSLAGSVTTDDVTNPNDVLGAASYAAITSWTKFDNAYRAWGADGAAGRCTAGGTCRILDWSVAAGDTGNGGAPALLNALALPTGDETLTLRWLAGQTSQADCDTVYPGSVWDGAGCRSTFLRHAVEFAGDSIGNDNYLCESNETCLYMPNIGSYQGHGDLVSAGSFTGGTLTNITLMKYSSNGR